MGAFGAGLAVECLEPGRPEGQPPLGLGAVTAGQHLGYRGREVVIPDLPERHPQVAPKAVTCPSMNAS